MHRGLPPARHPEQHRLLAQPGTRHLPAARSAQVAHPEAAPPSRVPGLPRGLRAPGPAQPGGRAPLAASLGKGGRVSPAPDQRLLHGSPEPPGTSLGPAGVPRPAPESPGSARLGACGAGRGHPARALGTLCAPATPEALRRSERLQGRGRVLANIYSQIHNYFAFFFCHLVAI